MKIHSVTNSFYSTKQVRNNNKNIQLSLLKESALPDSFVMNRKNNLNELSFGASPIKLDLGKYANKTTLTGKEAIEIFKKFKSGNYLDLNGVVRSRYDSSIRRQNISFLDKVIETKDKQEFVEYYKELTGFPSLGLVAYKIKDQFKAAAINSEKYLFEKGKHYQSFYEIATMGYDGVSSVERKTALPGSDLDKAYVVIKGCSYSEVADNEVVNEFKEQLWRNTDQRVLSYNHDADSFPKVYSETQIKNLVKAIDKVSAPSLIETIIPGATLISLVIDLLRDKEPPTKYNYDYVDANSHFIRLCKKFPIRGDWDLDSKNPSRENIYSFGFIAEAMYRGEVFKGERDSDLRKSEAIKLLNVSQINALKHASGNKEKYQQREQLAKDFNSWSVDKQFSFVKSLILASCGEKTDFPEYFASNTEDKFLELMRAVGLWYYQLNWIT